MTTFRRWCPTGDSYERITKQLLVSGLRPVFAWKSALKIRAPLDVTCKARLCPSLWDWSHQIHVALFEHLQIASHHLWYDAL